MKKKLSDGGNSVLSLKACKLNHEETEWEANTAPLLSAAVQNSGQGHGLQPPNLSV